MNRDKISTINYLYDMANEMKKMAHDASLPSLELIFDMASYEAKKNLNDKSD